MVELWSHYFIWYIGLHLLLKRSWRTVVHVLIRSFLCKLPSHHFHDSPSLKSAPDLLLSWEHTKELIYASSIVCQIKHYSLLLKAYNSTIWKQCIASLKVFQKVDMKWLFFMRELAIGRYLLDFVLQDLGVRQRFCSLDTELRIVCGVWYIIH